MDLSIFAADLATMTLYPPPKNLRQTILIKALSSIIYMNKDLARVSVVWRALFGVWGHRFYCLSSCCQRGAENGLAADYRSVSGDGRSFRCCTVGELWLDCDLVSVLGVQEKCDEKRQALTRLAFPCRHFAASRENNFRCHELAVRNARQSRKPAPETFRTLSPSRVRRRT